MDEDPAQQESADEDEHRHGDVIAPRDQCADDTPDSDADPLPGKTRVIDPSGTLDILR